MEPRFGTIVRASLYITACLALSCAQWDDHWRKSSKTTQTKGETPPALQQIDRKATDVVVTVPTGDWPRVYALIQDINDTWLDFRNQVYGLEVPLVARPASSSISPRSTFVDRLDAAVYVLQYAATAQDSSRTMNTANLISALAGDLYEYYTPSIPPEIHRINVLERQVVLDAADDNLADIAVVLTQIREAWHQVRPSVETKSSIVFANQIEESIAGQQAAFDNGDNEVLTSRAKKTLEMLGEAERLYQVTSD
jgi:hypothetical protein